MRSQPLLAAMTLVLAAAPAPAHDLLEEVVITATPLRETMLETAQPVRALDGEALLRERASSLGETLATQPGITAAWFGPQASRPVIRGIGGERVQMYQDGGDALDASALSNDHAVTIDPLVAERVEIVRGPATLLFGNSASAGLVNVITRRIPRSASERPFGGAVELRADSAREERAVAAQAEFGQGPWRLQADLHRRTTDDLSIPGFATTAALRAEGEAPGRLANSAAAVRGGGVGLARVGDFGHVGLAFSRFDTQYEIPGPPEAEEADGEARAGAAGPLLGAARVGGDDGIYLDMVQTRWDLDADLREPLALLATLRLRAAFSDYEHAEIEPGGKVGTIYLQRGLELRAAAEHTPLAGWRGVLGAQWRDLDLEAIGEEAFVPPSATRNLGLFLFEERNFGALTAEFGLRLERQRIDLPGAAAVAYDEAALSASAGLIWRFADGWRVAANLNSTERHPTATELFADGPHVAVRRFELGDAQLGTERALGFDLGLHVRRASLSSSISAFVSDYRDYIYAAPTGDVEDGLPVIRYSAAAARFTGVEAELGWQPVENALGRWAVRLFGDYVRAEDGAGAPLPQIPPLRLGAALALDRGALGFELRAVWHDAQQRVAAAELPTDGFTIVDLDLTWRGSVAQRPMTFFVRGANLLDEEARRHASPLKDYAPLPGRSLGMGARFDF